jgi:hypothetical protein
MANALRRKMFKMGGNVPKAHGVGITSGLKMKKGGTVHVGVGSGNQPKKMGPDGKMRDAHAIQFLPFLQGLGTVGLRTIPTLLRSLSSRSTKPITDFVMKSSTGSARPTAKQLARMTPEEIARTVGKFGFGPTGRGSQIARGAATGIGGLAPIGALSSLLPELEKGKDKPVRTFIQNLREIPELATDIAIGAPSGLIGALAGQGMAGFSPTSSLQRALYGAKEDKVGSKLVKESEAAKTQREQKDEFAGLEDKAARMAAAITKEDNLATLSQAASNFGAAALAGEDLPTAVRTGTQPIFDELGRRRAIEENVAGTLAQAVLADEATQSAMIAEAAKTGDPQAVNRMQKYFDGYNEGVTNILPIDAKGKPDYANMAPGTVYMDLEGVTGGRYFASNADGSSTQPFDSVEDANAFAQS